MPPQRNNWDITYSHISFMERVLRNHSRVESFSRTKDVLFSIRRHDPLCRVIMVLINRYTVSLADVYAVKDEFPPATCIVTAGDWNAYTAEAKEACDAEEIGLFITSEFLGALNRDEVYSYVRRNARGEAVYAYRNS